MSTGTEAAYDYEYILQFLTNMLLRELWNSASRKNFINEFVAPVFPADFDLRPIVGIGMSQSEGSGRTQLEVLSTIDPNRLQIGKLLASKDWGGVRFNVTKTGRIMACSRPAQGGDPISRTRGQRGTLGCVVEDQK